MAHYSLFLPGQRFGPGSHLKSVGLEDLEAKCGWDWCEVIEGPDGNPGVIGTILCADPERRPFAGMHESQKWTPCPPDKDLELEAGAFWFGYEPERPPTPTDLQHSETYSGKYVQLKDEMEWLIPETLSLPMQIGRSPETGELQKFYPDKFSEFCRMAERFAFTFFEHFSMVNVLQERFPKMAPEEVKVDFTLENSWEYCCTALSINYRVCDPIVGHGYLDLLDEYHMVSIIRATLAIPDIIEVIKKNKIDSPVSTPVGLNT